MVTGTGNNCHEADMERNSGLGCWFEIIDTKARASRSAQLIEGCSSATQRPRSSSSGWLMASALLCPLASSQGHDAACVSKLGR